MQGFMNFNAIGNIVSKPELLPLKSGTKRTCVRLAVEKSFFDKKTQEWKKKVGFHAITFWGRMADSIVERCDKGSRIYVEGSINVEEFDDNTGKHRWVTYLVASKFILLSKTKKDTDSVTETEKEKPKELESEISELEGVANESLTIDELLMLGAAVLPYYE